MRAGERRHGARNLLHHFVRADEILELHLLELARAEGEVPRVDLVAERFADLADAKRHPLTRHLQRVLELHEDRLRRLRPEIRDVVSALHRANVGLEHQVEWPRLRQQAAVLGIVAGRVQHRFSPLAQRRRLLQPPLLVKLRRRLARALRRLAGGQQNRECVLGLLAAAGVGRPAVEIDRPALRLDLVSAEPLLGQQAIHHQIAERACVSTRLPDPRVHDDRGVQTYHVVPELGHGAPPALFDVALQLSPQRTVVPEAVQAPVDLRGLEDQPPPLAQRHNLLHQPAGTCFSHRPASLSQPTRMSR